MTQTHARSIPWNKGHAWRRNDRARTWAQVRRLTDRHGLALVDCIRYMVPSDEERVVLILREIGRVPLSYEDIAIKRGFDLASVEMMETRGLLHLLSRLCEYDAHVGGLHG